jgi:hypothetical protein
MQGKNIMRMIKSSARKILYTLLDVLLIMALLALFDLAILNFVTGCCEPGGACIPDSLYPQCRAIHEEVRR